MNCGHGDAGQHGWCLKCVHELNARLEVSEEETSRWKSESARLLAEGRHAKVCFDAAQEQAVRLAGEVDRLRGALEAPHSDAAQLRLRNSDIQDCLDLNNDEFARIMALTDNSEIRELCDRARRRTWQTVPMIEQLERANDECCALKRLRDELIELNDRLKVEKNRETHRAETAEENHRMEKQRLESCKMARELIRQQNESWHRRAEQLNRDIDELRERAEVADERLDKKSVECGDLQTAINNALELVNKDCSSMYRFVNIVPTVAWLLQKWRECRKRWQESVAKVAVADDDHHAMMNGQRIAQSLGIPHDKGEQRCQAVGGNAEGKVPTTAPADTTQAAPGNLAGSGEACNFPIPKCQCSDSPGWTAIRCCNLCGLMHNSETLDWRTGPLEQSKMPSDTPRTDAVTIACGWDTTQPVVPKPFAQELERECALRERNRREVQKEWERSHDAWRNAQVRCETLLVALKETNYLIANEPQAWAQTKTDQMRRNQELIYGK